ncbi:hypothetical protein [Catellatospora chokoriensis]|uniref:HEAT repeat domain-containing protein n=1 Tax=Catellatospora chokoriensis TaxID=310353 RepID=A0A8J3K3G8_9ACTN|nr:hypothetical protein [Catellatospora chokoriensis]GIF87804.1 hypothetical protein Cch02nite_12480 [Catellatospora chokoriensis]
MPHDLNSIDWASLTHAYGSAEDVPDLIRALRSPDAEARREAMYELYGNIHHQGSRYEASAYAVPFLLELAADPTVPDRHEVIHLLADLAVGYGHRHAATGYPITSMREAVAQVPDQTWQSWSQAMKAWYDVVSTGQRQPLPLTKPERRLLETRHELAAYDAVQAGVPMLLDCLTDLDAEVAGAAIHTLAWFPEQGAAIRPGLIAVASDNRQPVPLAGAALVVLGLLGGAPAPPVADLLDANLAGADAHLRWSAALAWAHLGGDRTPDSAVAELRTWAIIREQDTGRTAWGHRGRLALKMLDRVAAPVAEQVRAEHVAEVLAEQPSSNWHNHFNVVLDHAFPEMNADHGRTFAELTAGQQAAVVWLVENPHVFDRSGPDGPLRRHGLPTTHETLRSYAGRDA